MAPRNQTLGGWGGAPYKGINTTMVGGPITRWIGFGGTNRSTTGSGMGYTNANQQKAEEQRTAGFDALKRGEERFGQTPTMGLLEQYIASILPKDKLSDEQKARLEQEEKGRLGAHYQKQMGIGKRTIGRHLGGAGLQSAGAMASWKSQKDIERSKALAKSRRQIASDTFKQSRDAQHAAGRLGLGMAEAGARSADPFTRDVAKYTFQQSLPNV